MSQSSEKAWYVPGADRRNAVSELFDEINAVWDSLTLAGVPVFTPPDGIPRWNVFNESVTGRLTIYPPDPQENREWWTTVYSDRIDGDPVGGWVPAITTDWLDRDLGDMVAAIIAFAIRERTGETL